MKLYLFLAIAPLLNALPQSGTLLTALCKDKKVGQACNVQVSCFDFIFLQNKKKLIDTNNCLQGLDFHGKCTVSYMPEYPYF